MEKQNSQEKGNIYAPAVQDRLGIKVPRSFRVFLAPY